MSGPWEKYAAQSTGKPWEKYAQPAPTATMPNVDPMGNPAGGEPVPYGGPTPMQPGRDPITRQQLPEEQGSAAGTYMNLTGGFNRELGKMVSWPARLVEGFKNDFVTPDAKTNYVNEFMDRNYNSTFDKQAPVNGWERGFRRGGEVLADMVPLLFGQNGLAAGFGRTEAQQGVDLAQGTAKAMRNNPAAFAEGSKAAVPGMGIAEAAKGIPQALIDSAKANPTVMGVADAAAAIGSGVGEQLGGEHADNPQTGQTMGSLIGGALPMLYSVVSPGMLLGKMAMEGVRRSKRLLPGSDTFDQRQA